MVYLLCYTCASCLMPHQCCTLIHAVLPLCPLCIHTVFVGGGVDYFDPATLLTFGPNNSSQFPFVPRCDNVGNEGTETARLSISVQPQDRNLVEIGDPSTTTISIIGKHKTCLLVCCSCSWDVATYPLVGSRYIRTYVYHSSYTVRTLYVLL